ncbi:hypothetical protein MSSIH_0410 [Methanosarcina siciliae HI350]|uniref:YrhK domain-containing protein n=1 Tax=Methanosarcina siciliae HI350 TaxID=1434119 RepID=A0A0E3PAK1_9EURY|nr:hypothetical protein [Methanosarcina siciliae]AKB31100.1 hypothetical protein MSSIH_0410 [Methanosarcina siciliae HI350]
MSTSIKRGYIYFPDTWEHIESQYVGPFATRIVHRRPDGTVDIRTSRRHRKRFGPEPEPEAAEKKRPKYLLWRPRSLNWWIAVLFMIGASNFALGSVLFLAGFKRNIILTLIFFIGSIFFTSAGYSQYHQSINAETTVGGDVQNTKRKWLAWQPVRIDFWVTFSQFLGTIMFNFNTFDAFLNLGWIGQDLLIWVPDMVGSIFFQISGTLAVFEICHRWWCWRSRNIDWWITIINFVGCVAFLISAFLAYIRPDPIFDNLALWSTAFTLIGAVCFFVGAYLMWPEMAREESA